MGKVSLNINGRSYGLGCETGEEERLMRLGQRLDARVAEMANQFGQIGDLRLLVMAGITLLDEMDDPKGNVDAQVNARLGSLRAEADDALKAKASAEVKAAESLMSAAQRIERLAERLSDSD
ncbi:cell division protein ZapA [Algimonas porphyrae]|uniref:Cell division protein ZapA n=1 Tax=Algimonas porphyrae TaxID=1128113 RepID=A0ABQ5V276_9PROT|nr:cell division protein ZapA [Algimonas porphyrae]GLQ20765.1 cell division protein ZapA [Algimonas porphyrae]